MQDQHPVTMAMKKSVPARLPKKEVIQTLARLISEDRRCRNAVTMNCEPSTTVQSKDKNWAAYHDIAGEEIGTAENYHDESNRKEQGRDRPNQTWCIFLVPGSRFRGQHDCAPLAIVRAVVRCRLKGALGSKGAFASKTQVKSKGLTNPKPNKGPDMKEFQNNLSHLICVFLHPILETNSMVCWGVKASMDWAESNIPNNRLTRFG